MTRQTHYTQQPSRLHATASGGFTRVHGGGFVTRAMLEQTIDVLRRTPPQQRPGAMLVDLRELAGYESSCLYPAHQFLHEAASLGVNRIALVASSSVMRTASLVAAPRLPVELRTFEHEPSAARWLVPGRPESGPVPMATV